MDPWVFACILIGVLVISVLFSKLAQDSCLTPAQTQQVKALMQRAADSSEASAQDRDPVLALRHAIESQTYIDAVRVIATDAQVEKATNIMMGDFASVIRMQAIQSLDNMRGGVDDDTKYQAVYSRMV